jgi:outer membrane lipoprotein SlyB
MLRKSLHVLAVAAMAALPLAASAQYNGQSNGPYNGNTGDTLLPSQTVITGTLEQSLNSKTAQVGDPFVLDVVGPFPGDDQRYQGAKIYGHVAAVTRANSTHKGQVVPAYDRLTLVDGTTASLAGQTLSLDAKQGGNTTGRAIAGGFIGQVLGNYIGKHIGTDVGGAVGMIGGAIYAGNLGTNVTIGQGTTISLKTTTPSTVLSRRQAGYPNGNGGYQNQPYPTPYPTPYH